MEKKIFDLNIDPEFKGLIPPLQDTELSMLTESLLENGCEMPLMVWNGTIVDGHNRYRICRENSIPFAVEEKNFDSRDAAKIWLIKNQLGRRNLPDFARCELVLPLRELLKAEAKERQLRKPSNFVPPTLAEQTRKDARDALAELAGVSHGTMDKAKKIVESADEETKDKLRRGEMSIHRAYTDLKKPKEEPQTEKTADPVTEQVSPKQPEPEPRCEPEPQPKKPERPKFESLLDKPIFDRNQRTQIDGPILFQPVVSAEAMAAFEAAKRKEEAALRDVDDNAASTSADVTGDAPSAIEDEPEAEPGADVDAADTVEQDVQELIDGFLEELSSVLDSVDSMDAERILEMVRDAGVRAVHTVETYMKKMEG